MVDPTVTDIMADLKTEEQRQEFLSEMASEVDSHRPDSISHIEWYASSSRANLSTKWAEKWALARHDEHVASLKPL
jgi:hypothetical protein